ncbi:hypothetical protein PR202_ga10014 [Eleusine coracana subsp. coracana]|uniref:Uncharacterized protein n=1 Tax=Eleusine coracana subsp. coracana TaxID=191504 RepID=A0AAV5C5M1_ELECO|nr:hypothetical protein PR202_ga10014 [Eleusine coracana subsp. coracana]
MSAAVADAKEKDGKKEEKKDAGKRVSFTGLFRYADGTDVLLMLVGTVAALANGISQPLMTVIFGQMINAFGDATIDNVLSRVNEAVLNFVYLGIGTAVVSFLQVACWTITGERQAAHIRSLYLKSVLRQDIAFFDVEMTTGQVVSRMSGDTVLVQDAIGEKVGKFQQLVATFIGGFVVAFVKGWLLSLVMLACIPPIVIAGGVVSKILTRISSKGQESYSDAGNVVEQTLGAIKTVVSFNGEKQAIASYNKLIHKAYKAAAEEGLTNGFGMGSVFFIFFSSYGLAIWSLGNATPCMAAFAEGQSAAYRLFTTIKRKPDIDPDDPNGKQLEDIKGDVDLKDVYFSYPARPEQLIFDGFSLHVPRGTTMAIVGESGSGKSTVISLVQRFYDPQAGEVLIDGINIKTLQLHWIRGKIGLVSQEPLLFMTSIKDNITYGKEDATMEEIRRAAELANAANFIDKLPNGYDTMVGQRGAQLSGGQKQRIAIARAIIKNPKILLLDEATSALDVESERIVQEALNRIMVDRTTLVVAHRLTTVRNADCISVVQQGKIVEQGPHDKLVMNPDGAYSQLIRLQESREEEEQKFDHRASDLRSKSRSLSLKRSISRDSRGNSSRHSFTLPFGLPGSGQLPEGNNTNGENQNEQAGNGFVIAMIADWKLCLIIICVIPLAGLQGYAQVKFLKGFSEDAKMLYEDAGQVATDAVSSIRTVASFCAEKRVMIMYDHKCDASKNQGVRTGIVGGLGFGFSYLMLYLTYGLCFYVGAQFVRQGKSTFGDVFKVFFALMMATIGISQTSAMASDSTKAKDSAISIFALLDRKSEIDSSNDEGLTLDEVKGNIDFRHVSFKYPSRPDVQIFSDFTLHIPSGKTVALVGESGSGKSTVIALLERFYNPDSGTISLDGVEIKSLKVSWLRSQMGLVSQEPVLFNDTIRANIAYGKHGEVSEDELIKVAKAANAHEFISSLPQGYDTTVGERGIQLSGGQKQRVAIARAILKDPRILLLDEATSALDAESECIVQDALDNVMIGRTTVVVAHRLSTIKGADIIAVLKDGAIAEKGRHEALMNIKDGVYASLVELRSAS